MLDKEWSTLLKNTQGVTEAKKFQTSIQKLYSEKSSKKILELEYCLPSGSGSGSKEVNIDSLHERLCILEVIYQLNLLYTQIEFLEEGIVSAGNELYTQVLLLMPDLVKKLDKAMRKENTLDEIAIYEDLNLLSETLSAATQVIANPKNSDEALKKLTKNVHKMEGKPSTWKKVAGAVLCVAGVVLMGLCFAGAFHTGGFSLFGLPISKKCIATGIFLISGGVGIGLFWSGRQKGVSKATAKVIEEAEKTKNTKK